MLYKESRDLSAECLRMVLPIISRNGLAANPVNYTVCYEYVTGINPKLKQAFDDLVSKDELDDHAMEQLYLLHVSPCNIDHIQSVEDQMGAVLTDVSESVREANNQASFLNSSISNCRERLAPNITMDELRSVVDGLASDTHSVKMANEMLQSQLSATMREVEDLRQELDKARMEALTDPLTGLINRKGLADALEQALAEYAHGSPQPICLLMLDIDRFKNVNDNYGHLFGDKVIRMVAKTIADNIKGKDTAARYGGEEFAVLLRGTHLAGAESLAETMRLAIGRGKIKRLDTGGSIGNVTISIGVACHDGRESALDLIGRADAALYASKESGRNRVTVAP